MPFTISEATHADIPAISRIFLMDGEEHTPFMQLCLGSVDRNAINMRQSNSITGTLEDPTMKWFIARDQESKKTAAFAQWQLPKPDGQDREDAQMSSKDIEAERKAYKKALTPGLNMDLCVRFKDEIESLRSKTLKARRHYLLMNLGTSAAFQRKGAASTLVRWPFDDADKEGVLVYLDTAIDGPGRSLYEKLGFKRVGECNIDLAEYGGEGTHTHIAMIRYPQENEDDFNMPNFGGA